MTKINPPSAISSGTLAQRMRWLRKSVCHMTQKEFASQCGSNQSALQKIENGRSYRPRNIMSIAVFTGYNPAWIMYGEPYAQPFINAANTKRTTNEDTHKRLSL